LYAKDPRLGHEYFLAVRPGLVQLATLGLYVPKYARVAYPENVAVGNFTSEAFDPDNWKSNYPNAAFENRLPGDEFWAAKQMMAFSDDEIRAIVQTGAYSDPQTPRQIAEILIARRDAIGRTFFSKILPLDRFRIDNNRLTFDDLAAIHGLRTPGKYEVTWTRVNNAQPGRVTLGGGQWLSNSCRSDVRSSWELLGCPYPRPGSGSECEGVLA